MVKKIFIGSLPKEDFSSDDLKEYFGQWGFVTDSYVSPGRGFGFITYESTNGAYKALIHGSNHGHTIGSIEVNAKWPIPKEPAAWRGQDNGFGGRGFGSARGMGGASRQYSGGYGGGYGFQQERSAVRSYSSGGGGYQASGRRWSQPY